MGSHYLMELGLSMLGGARRNSRCQKSNDQEEEARMDSNLLSRAVHELIVCTTEHLPVTREGGMGDEEVVGRVAISIPYFRVVDTDPVSGRRLDVHVNDPPEAGQIATCRIASYLNHQLVGATSIGDEVRLNQWTEPPPFPFLVRFLRQGLSDGTHLCAIRELLVKLGWKIKRAA